MNLFYYSFFLGGAISLLNFNKKLIFLLSLEIMMIFLVGIFFFSCFKNLGFPSFSNSMLFLIFMVLDSVLGISLLIFSSRSISQIFSIYGFI